MANEKTQPFGTGFLMVAALLVILLNTSFITDIVVYSEPYCSTGAELGEAGMLTDVSSGNAPGVCIEE